MSKKYDFSGWATKNDLLCSDGRTIRSGAFKHCDGITVPLVYQHQHKDPANVLGHALLKNEKDGVRAFGSFNDSPNAQVMKTAVEHGDITALSIYANNLTQRGGDVYHGDIKEVSLVLAGANPGAFIDNPILEHSGEEILEEAIIYTGLELEHGDSDEIEETIEHAEEPKSKEEDNEKKTETAPRGPKEIFDEFTPEQRNAVYQVMAAVLEDEKDAKHYDEDEEGDNVMKHNVFDTDMKAPSRTLTHADFAEITKDAKRLGSFKEAVIEHMESGVLAHAIGDIANEDGTAQTYGIADIDYLFPEARNLNTPPEFIKRDTTWVNKVINGTHHTPFSRVKSMFANITMEEARAKGYIKGNFKKEEVFTLLKRATDPQTIYKKQKLDRDDVIDITDFDVVRWIKGEMRMMLEEEIARAVLIGDGRSTADEDHISEDHIRPILKDAALYTVVKGVTAGSDDAKTAKNIIRTAIKSRKDYKGSGSPTLFTTEDWLAEMLLLEDGDGHFMYTSEAQLATTLRVKEIVTVPVLENVTIQTNKEVVGIIVNLADYNIGADKGGETATFEDFDIDYNQMKYLIETRISGALVKPFSAIVLAIGATDSSTTVEPRRVTEESGETGET